MDELGSDELLRVTIEGNSFGLGEACSPTADEIIGKIEGGEHNHDHEHDEHDHSEHCLLAQSPDPHEGHDHGDGEDHSVRALFPGRVLVFDEPLDSKFVEYYSHQIISLLLPKSLLRQSAVTGEGITAALSTRSHSSHSRRQRRGRA